ncbi:MAG TPA: YciI family protein [Rhizomicrobium sp.]|nr:YciI family protein [Rhizomicrobium sp.]
MSDSTELFFFVRLLPPRPTFITDMSDEERALMQAHAVYWRERMAEGKVIVFGPVADPKGPWGLGVVCVSSAAELDAFKDGDPVIKAGRGFRYESLPMLRAVVKP